MIYIAARDVRPHTSEPFNMDDCIFLSIRHSSHQNIYISPRPATVRELKQMILERYNEGNPSDIDQIRLVEHDNNDEPIKSSWIKCINGNIYKRLERDGIKPESEVKICCAIFGYRENNATAAAENPLGRCSRLTSETLPFTVFNQTAKGDLDIELFKPRQLNWGFGPTVPVSFYRLSPDGQFHVYNVGEQPDFEHEGRIYKFSSRRERIINNVDTELLIRKTQGKCMTWKPVDECQVCLDAKINVIFVPCGHCVCCKTCAPKLKACTRCNRLIKRRCKFDDLPLQAPLGSNDLD